MEFTHSNQEWNIDITYVTMKRGFLYLTAIIDVYSRYVVGWGLSNSLDAVNCLKVLSKSIGRRCGRLLLKHNIIYNQDHLLKYELTIVAFKNWNLPD